MHREHPYTSCGHVTVEFKGWLVGWWEMRFPKTKIFVTATVAVGWQVISALCCRKPQIATRSGRDALDDVTLSQLGSARLHFPQVFPPTAWKSAQQLSQSCALVWAMAAAATAPCSRHLAGEAQAPCSLWVCLNVSGNLLSTWRWAGGAGSTHPSEAPLR